MNALFAAAVLLILSIVAASAFGTVEIPFATSARMLAKGILGLEIPSNERTSAAIVYLIRFPRVVVAALAGALLATAGALVQGLFRNPLADARIIGISIGAAPQQSVLTFPFRAEHVVLMGRAPHLGRWRAPDAADHRSVERAMVLTDTESLAGRDVTTLSGGEMQRIVLSRVLAQEPAVLLLDEPTASLDLRHQVEILTLLADLAREGSTVIAALHDLNLAATYCSTLVLLKEGRIVATGEPAEVMNAAVLREVFDVDVSVTRNPVTGTLQIVPLGPNGRGRKNRSDDGRESERWQT